MADILYDVDIDLSKNQLLNARLHNLTTPPTVLSGDTGLIYWNTINKSINIWDGDIWVSGGGSNISGTTNRITISGTQSNQTIDIANTYIGQTSITTLGIITGGTWQGSPIADNYISGASIWNNHVDDITIHFVQSGITINESQVTNLISDLASKSDTGHTHSQYALELDLTNHTGDTSIHFTQNQITTLSTITGGTWNGNIINSQYGGTGINNSGNTLTILVNSIISGNNTGDQSITISGDVVTSAMNNGIYIAALPNITSGGTFNNITFNDKGQVISGNTEIYGNTTVSDTTPTGTTNNGDFWYQPSSALLYIYVGSTWVITDATLIGDGVLNISTSGIGITGSTTFSANQTSGSTIVITSNATSDNTPLTIVSRDNNGNFSGVVSSATTVLGTIQNGIVSILNLSNIGIITGGTWQGNPINDTYISGSTKWDAKPTKFVGEITGNSVTTGFTITHNLNTVDIVTFVKEVSTSAKVDVVEIVTDINTLSIYFNTAPTTNKLFRITIIG